MAESTNNDAPTLSAVPSAVASVSASAAATPVSLPSLDDDEREKSDNVLLADLAAKGSAAYLKENYEEAATFYGEACEKQDGKDGQNQNNPKNAELLFLYGRTLFKIGKANSDILGPVGSAKKRSGSAPKPKTKNPLPESSQTNSTADTTTDVAKVVEESVAKVAEAKEAQPTDVKKPLFQFTGDENFEDSDEEEGGGEEEEEEEGDDLEIAFDCLERARAFFEETLEKETAEGEGQGKGKENGNEAETPIIKHIKERLSETHDILTEIELENARYTEAVRDGRASLKYKLELYPEGSRIVATAHYMLSLALEFLSITTSSDDASDEPKQLDQDLRDEAISELEKAIESLRQTIKNQEVELAMVHAPEDNEVTRTSITRDKDTLAEMEERLVDLQKPLLDVESLLAANDQVSGLLGAALGEVSSEAKARVEEAKKNANDLTGLVRKKTKDEPQEAEKDEEPKLLLQQPQEDGATPADDKPETTNGTKRKAEDAPDGDSEESKKAKVEEPTAAVATSAES